MLLPLGQVFRRTCDSTGFSYKRFWTRRARKITVVSSFSSSCTPAAARENCKSWHIRVVKLKFKRKHMIESFSPARLESRSQRYYANSSFRAQQPTSHSERRRTAAVLPIFSGAVMSMRAIDCAPSSTRSAVLVVTP